MQALRTASRMRGTKLMLLPLVIARAKALAAPARQTHHWAFHGFKRFLRVTARLSVSCWTKLITAWLARPAR